VSSGLKPKAIVLGTAFLIFSFSGLTSALSGLKEDEASLAERGIPILVYHRFGPVVADSMTVTTHQFESHLKYLRETGYAIIPLRQLVDYHLGKRKALPSRSIAMTVDDGHKSVYTDLLPFIKKYQIPVTLFLYPSAISNATYAMTWDQLREIRTLGLLDFQGHTYWHPNFKTEKKRLAPE
jgi:peptidoglycan/xylan/chitin deacetylase (PgdA/CDA1 family)